MTKIHAMGRGGGRVVSGHSFFSNDLSLNPAKGCSFFCKNVDLKERKKVNTKRLGLAHSYLKKSAADFSFKKLSAKYHLNIEKEII